MSLWLDEKYLRLLSPSLDHFVQKHPHVFNFRCPLCGDSEQNRYKARGYCFPKVATLMFKCHNCQMALPFPALLKRVNRRLFDEYMLEKLKDAPHAKTAEDAFLDAFQHPTTAVDPGPGADIVPLSEPSLRQPSAPLYPVYAYAQKRQIPNARIGQLWATVKAYTYLRKLVGDDKAAKVKDGLLYLVLPLTMPNGEWCGCQLRLLTRKEYITFRWSGFKVFGLDRRNKNQTTIVTEGPLDSLFVPNAIAACSSDLLGVVQTLEQAHVMLPDEPRIYCWDNEPRNTAVVKLMDEAIKQQQSIVILPRDTPKDLNDAALAGLDVPQLIRKHTYHGLRAALEFSRWKI